VAPPTWSRGTTSGRQTLLPIIRANEEGAELIQSRWGFPPDRPKGPTSYQYAVREPTHADAAGITLLQIYREAFTRGQWRFTKAREDWFCIAGLWRPVEPNASAFTMLTCEPGPDVAPIHNRQVVVLDRSEWAAWLNPQTAEADLLKPRPPGSLKMEKVEKGTRKAQVVHRV
jgi:putative SOS response-associated peptidase YedK